MKRHVTAVAVLAIAAALTACSSGAGTSTPTSAADLARKAGCVSPTQDKDIWFVREQVSCTINNSRASGQPVDIIVATYSTAAQRDTVRTTFSSLDSGVHIIGSTGGVAWQVDVKDTDAAKQVQAKLGGTIR